LTSGNGKQSVTAQIPRPFPNFDEPLVLPPEIEAWRQWTTSGQFLPVYIPEAPVIINDPSTPFWADLGASKQVTFGAINERITDNGTVRDKDGIFSISRTGTTGIDEYSLSFPLGNGKTLYVFAARDVRRTYVFWRGAFRDPGRDIIDQPVDCATLISSDILENDYDVYSHIAFVASFTEARQVEIPQLLIDEIYSRLRKQQTEVITDTVDDTNYLDIQRPPCLEQDPALYLGSYERFIGSQGIPVYTTPGFRLPSYGLESIGRGFRFSTPIDWFAIGLPMLPERPETHEEIQDLSMNNVKVSDVFKNGYYLGVTDVPVNNLLIDMSIPPSKRVLSWIDGLPSGDLFSGPLVPSPGDPVVGWKRQLNTLPMVGHSESIGTVERLYINDWGNPRFCRQQAERWGVANL
jgi:ribosomal protein S18 acetylase RimI-like enzyme